MSQAKIDKYKQEKYNRKKTPKKSKGKGLLAKACVFVVLAALVVYIGYSIAIETGLITPKGKQDGFVGTATAEELESKLQSYDPIGLYGEKEDEAEDTSDEASEDETKEAEEEATEAE